MSTTAIIARSRLACLQSVRLRTAASTFGAIPTALVPRFAIRFSTAPLYYDDFRTSNKKKKKQSRHKPKETFSGKKNRKKRKNMKAAAAAPKFRPPSVGLNGRPVMTEAIMNTESVSKFLTENGLGRNVVLGKYKDLCDKMGFKVEQQTYALGEIYATVLTSTVKHRKLVLPHIITPPKTARNVTDDEFELMSTGYGKSKKQSASMAAIDGLLQIHGELGIDFANAPSVKKLLVKEEEQRKKEELDRAQMRLELVKSPGYRRPRFDTIKAGQNAVSTEVSMRVGNQRLRVLGPPEVSSKKSMASALLEAAGEPLQRILGKEKMEHLETLIDAAPAKHMSPLAVDRLPQNALQMLKEAIGSPAEQRARLQKIQAAQVEHEDALALKMEAKWQAKLKREQEKFARFQQNPSQGLSRELEHYQDVMMREEQERAMSSGRQAEMQSIRGALPITAIRKE